MYIFSCTEWQSQVSITLPIYSILITSGSDGLMREQEGGLMPFEDNRCEEEDSRDPVVGTEGQQI